VVQPIEKIVKTCAGSVVSALALLIMAGTSIPRLKQINNILFYPLQKHLSAFL
jgi:hypothetical protein